MFLPVVVMGRRGGLSFYTKNFIDLQPLANSVTLLNYTQLYTVSQENVQVVAATKAGHLSE